MVLLSTGDYQGKERRNNGKLKLGFQDWKWIGTTIITLLIGGTIAWTTIRADVNNLQAEVERVKETPLKIAVIQEKVEGLEVDMEEIKIAQMIIQTDQKTLQKTMNEGFIKILMEIKNNGKIN